MRSRLAELALGTLIGSFQIEGRSALACAPEKMAADNAQGLLARLPQFAAFADYIVVPDTQTLDCFVQSSVFVKSNRSPELHPREQKNRIRTTSNLRCIRRPSRGSAMDSISVRTSIACCGADGGEDARDVQSQVIIPRRPRPYMPPSSQRTISRDGGAWPRGGLELGFSPSPRSADRVLRGGSGASMNDAAKLEARLLTAAEIELVAVTRPPEIERQSVDELKSVARRLREAHDRAKAIGTRQAREMRGKAEPRGATPGEGQFGNRRQGASVARRAGSGGGGTGPPRRGRRLRSDRMWVEAVNRASGRTPVSTGYGPRPQFQIQTALLPHPRQGPHAFAQIVSITSSAPPAMEARRPSRKARLTGVSFM